MAELHPDPYRYDDFIFLCTLAVFLALYAFSQAPWRSAIVQVAALTVVVFASLFVWYWWGAWKLGVWYPHAPAVLEHVMRIDGESGYNVEVSNLFLFVWPVAVFSWWLWKQLRQHRHDA